MSFASFLSSQRLLLAVGNAWGGLGRSGTQTDLLSMGSSVGQSSLAGLQNGHTAKMLGDVVALAAVANGGAARGVGVSRGKRVAARRRRGRFSAVVRVSIEACGDSWRRSECLAVASVV